MDAREVDRRAERRSAELSRLTQRSDAAPKRPGAAAVLGRRALTLPRLRHRPT